MPAKNSTTEPLVVERTFNAPAERVWQALTDVKEINKWFFDLPEFKPEKGFAFQFAAEKDGVKYDHRCKIIEVIPGKKLAYSWRYEGHPGNSVVSFELFPEGGKTRLKLTHEGLESFPKTADFVRTNFMQGWTSLIGTFLKDALEKPASGASDTADREIVISREFDAPRELVWEAWTDPKQVAKWWGPRGFSTTTEVMDVRPGGHWKHVMHGPDGANYPNHSVFEEVVKPERIVYAHGGHKEGGGLAVSFKSTWTFEDVGDKTRVTIHMVFPTAEMRNMVVREFGAIEGGKQTLERLEEYVTKP